MSLTTKKFTQKELQQAKLQMIEEFQNSITEVEKAVDWLRNNMHGTFNITVNYWQQYINLIHQTYGPYETDYRNVLDNVNWATKLPDGNYEIDTPYGKYLTRFQYFDNHFAGY